jgi:hypothetical protein
MKRFPARRERNAAGGKQLSKRLTVEKFESRRFSFHFSVDLCTYARPFEQRALSWYKFSNQALEVLLVYRELTIASGGRDSAAIA